MCLNSGIPKIMGIPEVLSPRSPHGPGRSEVVAIEGYTIAQYIAVTLKS